MAIELGEFTAAFRKLLMLISRKSELVLTISELNMKRTIAETSRIHLLEWHWGAGHNAAHQLERQVRELDDELEPLTSEYAEVCSQIDQIVDEMKREGYDLTA